MRQMSRISLSWLLLIAMSVSGCAGDAEVGEATQVLIQTDRQELEIRPGPEGERWMRLVGDVGMPLARNSTDYTIDVQPANATLRLHLTAIDAVRFHMLLDESSCPMKVRHGSEAYEADKVISGTLTPEASGLTVAFDDACGGGSLNLGLE